VHQNEYYRRLRDFTRLFYDLMLRSNIAERVLYNFMLSIEQGYDGRMRGCQRACDGKEMI